jgi:TolA-binding protein
MATSDKPLTVEELDEFERACEAFVQDDPEDEFGKIALKILRENRELRHLLRTLEKTESQKTVIKQADRIEKLQEKVNELTQEREVQGNRIQERTSRIQALEEELERTRGLLTEIATATGAALGAAALLPPPIPVSMSPEATVASFNDKMASETGILSSPKFSAEKPTVADIPVHRAHASSKRRKAEEPAAEPDPKE